MKDNFSTTSAPPGEAVLGRLVEQDQQNVRAFLDQLLHTGVRPFVISAPWPTRHHPAITETGVRPEIVQAIDARARALFIKLLDSRGIDFVPPPPETADEEGFLKPRFARGGVDPHHANGRYGRIMMRGVMAKSQGAAAA